MPESITKQLLESTKEGLFIDLSKIRNDIDGIWIPISAIGDYMDMDKVYDFKDEVNKYLIWLVYSEKEWKFIKEV